MIKIIYLISRLVAMLHYVFHIEVGHPSFWEINIYIYIAKVL